MGWPKIPTDEQRRAALGRLVELNRRETIEDLMNSNDHIMQFFDYDHLPPHLREVSEPYAQMADKLMASLPRNPERAVALRKLLESKDPAVRARLAGDVDLNAKVGG